MGQFFSSWMHTLGLSPFMWENIYGLTASKCRVLLQALARHAHLYNFALTSDMCEGTFTISGRCAQHCSNAAVVCNCVEQEDVCSTAHAWCIGKRPHLCSKVLQSL